MTMESRRDTFGAPLISVIVPAFNASCTLRGALDALQGQSVKEFEAIIIDDGSSDDTCAIARGFTDDARFRVVSQDNQGVSASRNVGLSLARGDWVAFLDADDTVAPTYLAGMLAGAKGDVDMVCGGAVEEDVASERRSVKSHEKSLVLSGDAICQVAESVLDNETHGIDGYCPYVSGYICAKLYRRSTLASIRFDAQIGMREDALFNISMLSRSRSVSLVREHGYVYRLRKDSASARFRKDYRGEIELFLSACKRIWTRWNLDALSLDKGVLISYMSWIKLHALHGAAPYSRHERNQLIRSSFDDRLWAESFERIPYSCLSTPYRLLKRSFLSRSVCAIRALKQVNDIKKQAL